MAIVMIGEREQAQIDAAIRRARKHPVPREFLAQWSVPETHDLKLADRKPDMPDRLVGPHPPQQVLIPVGYRASVSFEDQPIGLCLHLSISVEREDPKWMPSVEAATYIAKAFGITFPAEADKVWMEEYEPGRTALNILKLVEGTRQ